MNYRNVCFQLPEQFVSSSFFFFLIPLRIAQTFRRRDGGNAFVIEEISGGLHRGFAVESVCSNV